MCGIHGVLSRRGAHLDGADLHRRMGDITRHRGPDDHGYFSDSRVLLGMRRLSIIDVDGGHQPIANEDESIRVVCNGEIYNFREIRSDLTERGHRFRTASDTEVIVHLYEEYGDDFVDHLDGMYGFALWDGRRSRLLIGRDRLGIKPVYYRLDNTQLIFASEAKAILQVPGVQAEFDPAGLSEYLSLGYVPDPLSIFRGIEKLPPASLLICESGGCRIHRYWQLPDEVDEAANEEAWADELLEKIESAVVSQMVSDVPLGAFLSGGIDSSAIVALMSKHSGQPIKTYSIGFSGSTGSAFYNELPYARKVADMFQTDHHEIIVQPDVAALLPELIWHLDEPIADSAFITTYLVAQFARQSVTVILSGVGGDELFGGYRRYQGEYYRQYYNRLPGWMRSKILAPIARRLPSDRHSPLLNLSRYARSFILANELSFEERYRSYIQVFSKQEREAIQNDPVAVHPDAIQRAFSSADGDALRRLSSVDLATQLPGDLLMLTDKMSMATSLECRVPLLDHRVVELAARMPSRFKIRGRELKYILKRALGGLLPDEILYRKKRGFGAPMGAWLKHELSPVLRTILSPEAIGRRGIFDWDAVSETINRHETNQADQTDHLMALLSFELWCRMYLDGQSPSDLAEQIQVESGP